MTSARGESIKVVAAALATAFASAVPAILVGAPPRQPLPPAVPVPLPRVGAPPPAGAPEPAPAPPRRPTLERTPVALPEPPAEPLVTLDDLLRLPPAAPPEARGLDLSPEAPVSEDEPARAGRFRVDYSREMLLRDVPTQPERRRTDVGVSVRVDEADRLRVRGGVRVESKEGEEERETAPSVGVEVRF